MSWRLRGFAGLIFLTCSAADCCGVGGPELQPRSADDECANFGCPVAVGSELQAYVVNTAPDMPIVSASAATPGIADVTIEDSLLVVRPYGVGQSEIDVKLRDGIEVYGWIETAERATTAVAPEWTVKRRWPTYPGGRLQMFAGSTLRVVAEHRDATGRRLLGHGFEAWTITGGELREVVEAPPSDSYYLWLDTAVVRDVVATTDPLITIGARADGKPLEIDVVPAGSTARLRLYAPFQTLRENKLYVSNGYWSNTVNIDAFTADGRYIHGNPVGEMVSVEIEDAGVAAVEVDPDNRVFSLYGVATGSTWVTLRFDGRTERYAVTVP